MNEICQIYSGNETLLGSFEHYTAASPPWDFLLFIDSAATSWRLFTTHFWFWKHTFTLLCLCFTLLALKTHFEVCYNHLFGKPTVDSVSSCWGVFTFDWNVNHFCLFVAFICHVCFFLNLSVCCIFRFVCCICFVAAVLDAKASLHLPLSI